MVANEIFVEEIFELDSTGNIGTLLTRVRDERLSRGRSTELPSGPLRDFPRDPRYIFLPELESFGCELRNVNLLIEWLLKQSDRANRGEARLDAMTVGYLCNFAAGDLKIPRFGPEALKSLRIALDAAGLCCRPKRIVRLRDDTWQPDWQAKDKIARYVKIFQARLT